jgi:hypothetical protein
MQRCVVYECCIVSVVLGLGLGGKCWRELLIYWASRLCDMTYSYLMMAIYE